VDLNAYIREKLPYALEQTAAHFVVVSTQVANRRWPMRLLGSWHDGSRDLSRRDADTRRRHLTRITVVLFIVVFVLNVLRFDCFRSTTIAGARAAI
jgi:hypothetical protein